MLLYIFKNKIFLGIINNDIPKLSYPTLYSILGI